ncbi:MAG TPA: protein kinase [Gemmatimonadales bacterium]
MSAEHIDRLKSALAGRYGIERELGQGGMATVYLAYDVRHSRKVALKVLKPELAAVIGAERFLHEIKTTANLQHPHILPLHDSGSVDGTVFYVMPFVEGESLRDRLNREKQLSIADAVRITREVASALDYAHRHGVIHRDIKPENILLHDGQALVADFGIALAASTAGGSRMTETGMSLGTPHYMSPEQAMGERTLDARTDVYALGCVLYEMLIGEPPFTGPTVQAIVAKVMTGEPVAPTELRKSVPPEVEDAVLTALVKLPADRFASAAAFAEALGGGQATLRRARRQLASPAGRWPPRLGWTLTSVAALLGLAGGVALSRAGREEGNRQVARFITRVPAGTHLPDVPGTSFAVSPDGSALVYVGQGEQGTRLFVKRLDQLGATPIPGTTNATTPFFSPDGRWVAFSSPAGLQRVLLAGGPVETIGRTFFNGADWGADGTIVTTTETGLRQIPADGGPSTELTTVPSGSHLDHAWPSVVPSADAVLFTVLDWSRGLQAARVAAVLRRTKEVRTLVEGAFAARVLPNGYLVFARANGTLEAARFDPKRLLLLGKPVPVLDGVRIEPAGETDIAISRTGLLFYLPASTLDRRVIRIDRAGRATPLLDRTAFYEFPTVAPDGRHLAVRVFEPSGLNTWVYDLERGTGIRITAAGSSGEPAWSRDGRQVVVSLQVATPDTSFVISQLAADGSGTRETLFAGAAGRPLFSDLGGVRPAEWTPDGRRLVVTEVVEGTMRIALLTPGDSVAVRPLVPGPAYLPALAPNGRWLAYVSPQTGRDEIYLRSFVGTPRQWAVSAGGGSEPRWGPDGRELFYRRGRQVLRVPFRETGGEPVLGTPTVLFEGPYVTLAGTRMWDVSPDGQWFVMVEGHEVYDEFVTVLDWFDEIEKRVGRAGK